jgi:TPR repeat protein
VSLRSENPVSNVAFKFNLCRYNPMAATASLQKSAAAGSGEAQFLLAKSYFAGMGVARQDYAEAAAWLKKTIASGHEVASVLALYYLGTMHERGLGGLSRSSEEARRLFKLGAEAGDANAQNSLGLMYGYTFGNYREGIVWLRKAGEAGEPTACFNCGLWYKQGQGVEQDWTVAAVGRCTLNSVDPK